MVIALAGNKADMEGKRKVQTEEAQQYARDSDIIHMETSAKTAANVRDLFIEIGELLLPFEKCNTFFQFLFKESASYLVISRILNNMVL